MKYVYFYLTIIIKFIENLLKFNKLNLKIKIYNN